jgi:uncharacterized protein YkwD
MNGTPTLPERRESRLRHVHTSPGGSGRERGARSGEALRWRARDATIADVPRIFGIFGLIGLIGVACSTSGITSRTGPGGMPIEAAGSEASLSGTAAATYATDPGKNGVVGGPDAVQLARTVADAIRARGDEAEPDERLAALAAWYHKEVSAGRDPGSRSERIAWRLGFVGALHSAFVFPMQGPESGVWRQGLTELARNIRITRYGVWTSPDSLIGVVTLAAAELTLDPFPRHLEIGQALKLRGEIAGRYARGNVFLTAPDGAVQQTGFAARWIDVTLSFSRPGTYKVEVMGDGATGPVVLANVPIYVGVPEPEVRSTAGGSRTENGDTAEQMLVLLNRARAEAGTAPVKPDPELRAVALAHSQEMAAGHFFGHVSPTTGMVADRVRRAGVLTSVLGENVSQGDSASSTHQGLMDSPGHRATMLDPRFTHVGIGVAQTNGAPPLVVTLVFARRPDIARLTAAEVIATIANIRRARRVQPFTPDPVLQAAAEAGMKAFVSRTASSRDQAMEVGNGVLRREDHRLRISRKGCAQWMEILELEDLQQSPVLTSAGTKKLGLAVALQPDGKPPLAVLVLVEGTACK